MSAYAHPVASVYANMFADVHNTCVTYAPAHAVLRTPVGMHAHTLRKKCTCTRACVPMKRYRNFFAIETIANLSWVLREHRTGCCLPPALLLSRQNQSPDAVRSKHPSKSRLTHDAVAAVVSHKHHSIIRVGADLIQFVYSSYSKRGHEAHPSQKSVFAIFCASFLQQATILL